MLFHFSAILRPLLNSAYACSIGVYPKTLRNMVVLVWLFNPLVAFFAMGVLSNAKLAASEVSHCVSHSSCFSPLTHWLTFPQ